MATNLRRRIPVSRYATVVASSVTHTDGSTRLAYDLRRMLDKDALAGTEFNVVVLQGGAQLDWVAWRYLGDSRLWWVVADLNRDVIDRDTLIIPAGTELIVPHESLLSDETGRA